ncbi:MAG: GNAT family N-acetyltransferase [Bacteroidaceae bacterium]|nr:GNAT family N-acetyltransferase [Bacteroidaceae bacterium]
MMIPFRPITAADADLLRSYTMEGKCMNCDLNVANLCSWQFLYHTEYAVVEGFLVLRFVLDGHVTYMKPIGKGDLRRVLGLLMADARSLGDTLRVACVCPCAQALMDESMPGAFTYTINRDKSDYLYLREKLVTLSGKKLQPKRNHISKFKRTYPNYEYRPLTPDLVDDCIRLGEEWCLTSDSCMQHAMQAEQKMIAYALNHIDELHIVGGTLFVEGKMVAFTFGSRINGEAFDVCVEKADTSYEGAYAMINNEFVSRLPEDIVYINREEDLGLEGLRKAKMSYYPDLIMDKMVATLTAQPQESEEEMRMRFETRHLWERSFADPRAFIDLYFREKYRKERNEVIVRDGRVVSALQKLPYPLTYGGRMLPASYISGACTDERYRRRGLMGELLGQTHRAMWDENAAFSFLIPATAELGAYYAKFGYAHCFRFGWKTETHPNPPCEGGGTDLTVREVLPHREDLGGSEHLIYLRDKMQQRPMCVQHPLSDLRAVIDDMRMAGDSMWEVRRGDLLVGLAVCRAEAQGVLLRECVYSDEEAREALIAAIAAHYGKTEVDVLDTTGCEGEYIGMARIINAETMLAAYAGLHPEVEMKINVTDNELSGNNGCYHICGGACVRMDEPSAEAEQLTIAQLTHKVLTEENPVMSLMMND